MNTDPFNQALGDGLWVILVGAALAVGILIGYAIRGSGPEHHPWEDADE